MERTNETPNVSFEDIKKFICDEFSLSDFFHEDVDKHEISEKFGAYERVHSEGGSGKGEYVERVWHFTDHDIYVKIDGSYYSYHGYEIDDITECRAEQKTITIYPNK